ncbi:hypothetical protein [Streptomyces antibioticus]|uniref:hypothetical protein n=1 Tax=Streptomyces antibioticus TaxID=1890 RepID=UPI001FD760B0|nr:hypothetical protein [Streptomyces antibioticus]
MNGREDERFEERLRELLSEDAETVRPAPAPYPAIRRRGLAERRRRVAAVGAALVTLAVVPAGRTRWPVRARTAARTRRPRSRRSVRRGPRPRPRRPPVPAARRRRGSWWTASPSSRRPTAWRSA